MYKLNDVNAWKMPIDLFSHDVVIIVAESQKEFKHIFDELYINFLDDEVEDENYTFCARMIAKKGDAIYLLLNSNRITNINQILAHESVHVFNQLMVNCGIKTRDEELMAYFVGWFCGEVISGLPKNVVEDMTFRWEDSN